MGINRDNLSNYDFTNGLLLFNNGKNRQMPVEIQEQITDLIWNACKPPRPKPSGTSPILSNSKKKWWKR